MKSTISALLLLVSMTDAYAIYKGSVVNCRSGPGTNYNVVRTYNQGDNVSLSCQTTGASVNGNNVWDKTTAGCYVSDYYVKTGSSSFVTSRCGGGSGTPGTNGNHGSGSSNSGSGKGAASTDSAAIDTEQGALSSLHKAFDGFNMIGGSAGQSLRSSQLRAIQAQEDAIAAARRAIDAALSL
ncbi:hypothetical protein GQ54DRAFT_340290 [Martensiomyces pterosporus]|nr:hypothetical protein GQ54DRAFT_340290 [Martensiomyces pterosporus]